VIGLNRRPGLDASKYGKVAAVASGGKGEARVAAARGIRLEFLFRNKARASGGKMQSATIRWGGGEKFVATLPSGTKIQFDAGAKHEAGPGPMEMLLGALGACTSVDVVMILEKKRQKLTSLEVQVSGERAKEPPEVWTKIEIVYRLSGELNDKAVRDAIELSQTKYCSVAAMLGKTAKITYRYEIVEAKS
jgi:putative redox protein